MIYNQNIIKIRINKQTIRDNIAKIKAKSKMVIAVLKGNAYGCGLLEMGWLCLESGIDFVAVSYFSEARLLHERFDGKLKILVLLPVYDDEELQYAISNDIRLTVTDEKQLHIINNLANIVKNKAIIHLKADCGLGRLGMQPDVGIVSGLIGQATAKNCIVEGVYTHLSRADDSSMMQELTRFDDLVQRLKAQDINIPFAHALSSAQMRSQFDSYKYDAVRIGSAIFAQDTPLRAVTHIIDVKTIEKGSKVGYGQDFILTKTSKIAFIPVGYSLGLGLEPISRYNDVKGIARISLSILNKAQNKEYQGSVIIDNRKYPIVGRVGMNISTVFLGDDDIPVGTEVLLSLRQAALPDNLDMEYLN